MTNVDLEVVFRDHKNAVYRFAWRMTGSPASAEDITQDVFVALMHQPERFDSSRGPLRSFLLGIARNLALKRWRSENRLEDLDELEQVEDVRFAAVPVSLERSEISELVGNAVRALPPLQREVLILAEYEELSLEEIARVAQSEVGTIKSRLHRARENLKRMLAPLKTRNPMRMTSDGTVR